MAPQKSILSILLQLSTYYEFKNQMATTFADAEFDMFIYCGSIRSFPCPKYYMDL